MKPVRTSEKFIIVSGLSGSGKSTAIKVFEDLGYYCVDNLPMALLPTFIELSRSSGRGPKQVALGVDIREREFLRQFPRIFRELRKTVPLELLFFESSPKILARRFSETRRRHPLAVEGPLSEAIAREIRVMSPIRGMADRIIDTSEQTVHELKKMLTGMYRAAERTRRITLALVSFGYKRGLPFDADIVLDVRFLPNPHFIADLQPLTGKNGKVKKFIFSFPETLEFLARVEELLVYLLPKYIAEGKSYLQVALGCTGGRHRSVALVEELGRRLSARGYPAELSHRDITHKEG